MQTLLNSPLTHIVLAALLFAFITWGIPAAADFFLQPRQLGKQRGMVLLGKAYAGYNAGTIVQLPTQEETALIAQGIATNSAGPVTPGAVSTTKTMGRVGIAAAGTSVVVTSAAFTTESRFLAYLSNAAADGTALYVTRITPANGSVTFTLNAAATAAVSIDWALLMISGELPPN